MANVMSPEQLRYERAWVRFYELTSCCFSSPQSINEAQVEIVRAEKAMKKARDNE